MEDMAFDDLILESVQSVTKAATSLINAATVAQKVLVAQGKMSKNAKKVLSQGSLNTIYRVLYTQTSGEGGQSVVTRSGLCSSSRRLSHWVSLRSG